MNHCTRLPFRYRWMLRPQNVRTLIAPKQSATAESSASVSGGKEIEESNKPLKFWGSDAGSWRGADTRSGTLKNQLPYKQTIIYVSCITFMIYFLILREENEIDERLGWDLYDHFGPEASRLKKAYDYNIKNNLPVEEILDRMREIGAPCPPRQGR